MIYLWINAIEHSSELVLWRDDEVLAKDEWIADQHSGDELLARIEALLERMHIGFSDLRAVLVNPGPGSFTTTRQAVTVANTLAWSHNIPVVTLASIDHIKEVIHDVPKHFVESVLPRYASPPSITIKKQ